MTMQQFALEKEEDAASVDRLKRLQADFADASEQLRSLESRWEAEKAGLNRVGDLKERIDKLRVEADRAQREGDLTRAAEILYGQIPAIETQVANAEGIDRQKSMVSEEVSAVDIAEVVSAWTGIPVGKMLQGESEKLLAMEDRIGARLIGQKDTVSRLVGAPPGYIGYEEGGQLTEAVRRRPYSVVLLDEVEKAHPEIFN